jgi:hypothetical protein
MNEFTTVQENVNINNNIHLGEIFMHWCDRMAANSKT